MTANPVKPRKPAPEPAAEPLLDLPKLMVGIRRKRRMWLSLALLGLIAGGLVAVFLPPAPSAETELLVVHENDTASDSGNLMQTDVAVLQTTKIAGDALKRLGSNESAEKFLKTYEGTGLTSNMMRIEVSGKTQADAVRRAKALADAFIADHVSRTQQAADADAKALIAQRDRTQAELTKVNNQINSAQNKANRDNNNDGQPDGAGISTTESESLYARRAELTAKVSDLSSRAETAGIGAPRVAAGTQIVDAPRAVPQSLIITGATNAAIGFGLMLAAGIAIAAIAGVVRDRPVLRKDISANLGASVIAQLSAPRRGPSRLWRTKRAVRERRRVAGTLVRLVRSGAGPVSVLELGSPRIAAALALDVAAELANDRDVVIIEDPAGRVVADDLPGRDLNELTGRSERPIRIIGADETAPRPPGEIRVGIGSVTPGTSWTDLRHLGVETLLVVRTGFADTAWLHTVARQLADCQIPIVGVVLVDPDPRDKSDGTLWDGLHTALRGHGLAPAAIEARTTPPVEDFEDEDFADEVPPQLPASAPARLPVLPARIPVAPAQVPVRTQAPAPAQAPAAPASPPTTPAPVPVASAQGHAPAAARWEAPTRPAGQPARVNGPAPVEQSAPVRIERPAPAPFARPIAAAQPPSGPGPDGPTRPVAAPVQGGSAGQPTPTPFARPVAVSSANGVAAKPEPAAQADTEVGRTEARSVMTEAKLAEPKPASPADQADSERAEAEPTARTEAEPGQTEAKPGETEAKPAAQAEVESAPGAQAEATREAQPEPVAQTKAEPAAPEPAAQAEAQPTEAQPADARSAEPQPAAEAAPEVAAQAETQRDEAQRNETERAESERDEEPKTHPERRPSWVPEPVAKGEPRPEPKPHPERKPSWIPEPVAKPTPAPPTERPVGTQQPVNAKADEQHDDRTPMPVHYPAPVPANGLNGRTPNADLPTKRFAPVQPHLKNGKADDVHDLPTKRFAPVRPDRGPNS